MTLFRFVALSVSLTPKASHCMQNYFVSNSPNSGHESRKQAWIMVRAPSPPSAASHSLCTGSGAFGSCISGAYTSGCCSGTCASSYHACYFCSVASQGGAHCFSDAATVASCAVTHNCGTAPEATSSAWGHNGGIPGPEYLSLSPRTGDAQVELWVWETRSAQPAPVEVTGLGTDNVLAAAGMHYTLVLKSSGAVWAMGENSGGQLGLGAAAGVAARPTPVEVAGLGTDNIFIAAGWVHTLVLKASGAVVGFGSNSNGELGLGEGAGAVQRAPAQVVLLGTDNVQLDVGHHHSLILKASGAVVGFGKNNEGQLGLSPGLWGSD